VQLPCCAGCPIHFIDDCLLGFDINNITPSQFKLDIREIRKLRLARFFCRFCAFLLKPHSKKTEPVFMVEEKQSRTELERNVEHLRYRLSRYQIVGEYPPVNLLIELKMAERLLQLESIETIRVNLRA
jgi:hypothetical protein